MQRMQKVTIMERAAQVAEGENHTLVARRDELNATMMEQGCTRDMDKWGTVWSQVDEQANNQIIKGSKL